MPLATAASYWAGDRLSWLEWLTIRSFQAAGHAFVLYTDEPVEVPLECAVWPSSHLSARRSRADDRRSAAIHSDLLRLKILQKTNFIWSDMDVVALAPLEPAGAHLHGFIAEDRVATGLLRLPHDSPALDQMSSFVSLPNPIPPWYEAEHRAELQKKRDAGERWTVEDLRWGTSGPIALTHFLKESGEIEYAQPKDTFYPVARGALHLLTRPGIPHRLIEKPRTKTVHVFGYNRKDMADNHFGLPPRGSWLEAACERFGVDPRKRPILRD